MGVFKDLEIFIRQNTLDPEHFEAVKKEINDYLHGKREFLYLSDVAQETLLEWEDYEKSIRRVKKKEV